MYLQDTFGFEWRTAGITLTHVPVLAFRDSIRLSGSTWVRIPLVLVVLGLAGRGLFSLLVT